MAIDQENGNPAPPVETDEFAAAFADLHVTPSAAPATAEVSATSAPAASPAAPTAPTPPAEPAPAATPTPPATPATPAAPDANPPADPAAPPVAAPRQVDVAAFEAMQAELAELKGRQAAPPATPTPPAAVAPIYTAAEEALITKYGEDWPDVAAAEALVRRGEYHKLLEHVFKEVNKVLAPVMEVIPGLQERTQLTDLQQMVPDYNIIRDPVVKWVGEQPDYLKEAFTRICESGTAAQVADLIGRFRKETAWVAPAGTAAPAAPPAAPTPPVAPAAKPNGLPAATVAAAAALRPVNGSRSAPVSQLDPNDFDAAFKEFTSTP